MVDPELDHIAMQTPTLNSRWVELQHRASPVVHLVQPKGSSQRRVCQTCAPPHREPNRSGMGEHRDAVVELLFDFHDLEGWAERCQLHEGHVHKLREACLSAEVRWHVLNFNSKELNEHVASLSNDRHEEDCGHAFDSADKNSTLNFARVAPASWQMQEPASEQDSDGGAFGTSWATWWK